MVSYATAVQYTESQPIVEKINKFENLRNILAAPLAALSLVDD